MGHTHRWNVEEDADVKRQPGAARVVPTGSVHQQHIKRLLELSYCCSDERPFPKR